jgi:hypothetical protein
MRTSAVRCSIACSCFGEDGLATPMLRKVYASYHAGGRMAAGRALRLPSRTTHLPLQVLDHPHETVSGFDDFSGVLRQLILVYRAVFDRSRATPNLAEFPLDLFEVCDRHSR